jgi:riboflavin biosynthesis pyrimidine reductase
MKPRLICHMTSSVDGRALVPLWHPTDAVPEGLWESARARIETDAAIMGRVTAMEYTQGHAPYPETAETVERVDFLPEAGQGKYQVVIAPNGSLAWGRRDIDGERIIVVVAESTSDRYLAGLRSEGIYYLFAGAEEIDLGLVLEKLGALGVRRLYLDGGPVTAGRFLHAGLIDEISLLLLPALDGYTGAPAIFEYQGERDHPPFPVTRLKLKSSEVLDGGVLWLRYDLENAPR